MSNLDPALLEIENESHNHHVPPGSETHFKLVVVAHAFENLERIDRHRKVNALLATELKTGLHALSLHLYSPSEWENKQKQVPSSPACRGGFRHG
ncbi:BolA family protein [Legionella sp. CNM-1927-20]|uniref:BolA family protein n=1 Tax=Legionella sp. CNM-1927-20 TaxID=3422221 RepID=UPI00403B111F